jgi:ribose/xylose/arabinose/galactoside ABC-type transport system permease subunit
MTDPPPSIRATDPQVEPPTGGSTDVSAPPIGDGAAVENQSTSAGEAQGAGARLRGLSARFDKYKRTSGLILALVVTCVIFTVESSYFLTIANFYNILLQAANLAIVAAGLTVVILVGEIDLSIGSVEALTGSVAAILMINAHFGTVPGVACALLAAIIVGYVNAFLTTKMRVVSFITTLAMLGIAEGLANILTHGQAIEGFPSGYQKIGQATIGPNGFPVPTVIAIVTIVVLYLLLAQTRLGKHMFAVGGSPEAARFAGIRPARVKTIAFIICSFCAGIGGIILSARLNAGNGLFGQNDLLSAVAAVVIGGASLSGGVASVAGTTIGVLLIATIEDGLVLLNVPDFWQQIVVGAFIVGAVMIDQLAKGIAKVED